MDASPLIKAHDHARAASDATRSSDSTVAVNEHALAAGEFSKAAESTGSIEAVRTLRLLEQQHRKLAELLQLPHEQPSQHVADSDLVENDEKQACSSGQSPAKDGQDGLSVDASSPAANSSTRITTQQQRRYGTRDLTSSIASNLATARGIRTGRRSQALRPSVSNEQAHGTNTKTQEGTPSWVPPTPAAISVRSNAQLQHSEATSTKSEEQRPTSPSSSSNDEGFSRFYNTFGSILNRLSAPLAFAGLPLITEESSITSDSSSGPPSPEHINPRRSRQQLPQTVSTSTEPDLSKIYSKATLRALGNHSRPNDSFYVVPTTGHTASYASILGYDAKEQRRRGVAEDSDLDLVETPALHKRFGSDKSDKTNQVLVEELGMENAHLKQMLDKVSKRLHAFEIGSQSSHLALAQSLRPGRSGSPVAGVGTGAGTGKGKGERQGDEAIQRRNRELEEELGQAVARIDQMEKEHLRMNMTIEKYRERWEKLKAGAKARRDRGGTTEGETSNT